MNALSPWKFCIVPFAPNENPWGRLDFNGKRGAQPWYVLPEDAEPILRNNARYGIDSNLHIQTQLLPEPYLGRIGAPVLYLLLNPHYTPIEEEEWHAKPELKEAFRRLFVQQDSAYPHIFLDPRFRASPGGRWWWKRLRHLVNHCTLEKVARNLLVVEYFPYHSLNDPKVHVESEAFSRKLVADAVKRDATIIVGRHWREMRDDVPALRQYRCLRTNAAQNAILTPGNLDGFWEVTERIKKGV